MTAVTRMRLALAAIGLLSGALLVAAPAGAATSGAGLYVTGAGFGHGIGMSQYGAAGYAQHGATYQQILRDYYSQTTLGHVRPNRLVTVLLKAKGAAAFSGATTIKGSPKKLKVGTRYSVLVVGRRLRIIARGRTVGTFIAPLQVSGPGPLKLIGQRSYRGAFVFRPSIAGSGVMTVNALGLDDYVRGVVAAEMPSSWPQQALDAQAVAARTYAITVGAIGADFDVYDDTRSQMYEGVTAETPATNTAVAATSGQVVDYDGVPAVTYFFASSGGQTESVHNVWTGVAPEAWLVGKQDPYDDSYNNPYYRWNMSFKLSSADAKLGKLVHGTLKGINVLQRGVSPRVVQAQVIGSKGTTTVSGARLEANLGTPSTWMSFTTLSASGVQTTGSSAPPTQTQTQTTTTSTDTTATTAGPPPPSGGIAPASTGQSALVRGHVANMGGYAVTGTIYPPDPGAGVTVQYRTGRSWFVAGSGIVAADGSYSVPVSGPGVYRVLYGGIVGPKITVR